MHQNRFDPAGEAYSAPQDPLAVLKRSTSKGKEGEGEERRERDRREGNGKGRGGEGEGKGREGRTTLHTPCRKFLATTLRTALTLH